MPDGQKSIFITGVGSGIGRATALFFAKRGWLVAGYDVNQDGLTALQSEGINGIFERLDVSDPDAVREAVGRFGNITQGRLDLLFNNAGIDAKGPFAEMPWERIEQVVSVNLIGGLALIKAAFPLLANTPGSICLSTASASAIVGAPGRAVYSATKHALKGLTEALSVEFASAGVRAADLLPGIIDTGMLSDKSKAMLPSQGMWRPLPASTVAEAVWAAYEGSGLHVYVPEELSALVLEAASQPEAIRDRRIAGSVF
jgi:NAD(P)-dependent dehydrogenase (short-subunit alcohol dehydrogenase family)